MAQIILDLGSGLSTQNDTQYVDAIVQSIKEVDTGKHEVILKAQLFTNQPPNVPLDQLVFNHLYMAGHEAGYKVTASVFDMESLRFLLNFEVPFIKIACREELYWLIMEVPRKVPVWVSIQNDREQAIVNGGGATKFLLCVPNYPALLFDYEQAAQAFNNPLSLGCVSDHTEGLALWYKHSPYIWEKHFVLERDPNNPDAGPFAVTPSELAEIL